MKRILMMLCVPVIFCASALGVTLQYTVQELGPDLFRIDYNVSGAEFLRNQELEIRFEPTVYANLSDGVAPALFDVLLVQPNNPPGTLGRFSALALVDNPDVSQGFALTVRTIGSLVPGSQEFAINQFDENGVIVSSVANGLTSAAIPEPAPFGVTGLALLVAFAVQRRRRFRTTI